MEIQPSQDSDRTDARRWFIQRVCYYRELGFFADPARSSESVARGLEEFACANGWDPDWRYAELCWIVLRDDDRVFAIDLEGDAAPGNDTYVEVIASLARISRGLLNPIDARESWARHPAASYKVTLSFKVGRGDHAVDLFHIGDWMDVGRLIQKLNDVLQPTRFRYWYLDPEYGGQACIFVVLDAEEKRRLETERGLLIEA